MNFKDVVLTRFENNSSIIFQIDVSNFFTDLSKFMVNVDDHFTKIVFYKKTFHKFFRA